MTSIVSHSTIAKSRKPRVSAHTVFRILLQGRHTAWVNSQSHWERKRKLVSSQMSWIMERRGVIFQLLYEVMLLLLLLMIPMMALKKTLLLMPFW